VLWLNKGDVDAQFAMGAWLSDDTSDSKDGFPRDNTAAIGWYQLAADQGSMDAINALGYILTDHQLPFLLPPFSSDCRVVRSNPPYTLQVYV
jgi:hypothetical protein